MHYISFFFIFQTLFFCKTDGQAINTSFFLKLFNWIFDLIYQVEVSINLNQKLLINFCRKNDITVTGYSPLGRPGNRHGITNLWDDPKIQELCKKYKKTPANIACRFIVSIFRIIEE